MANRQSHLILLGILSIPILATAYVGTFSRYVADDYCIATVLAEHGLLGSQWVWYTTWFGRYSATFSNAVAALVGPGIAPTIAATLLMGWFAAIAWFSVQLRLPAVSALVVMAGTLAGAPSIPQSLYWLCGASNYFIPLIVIPLSGAAVIWSIRKGWPNPVTALIAFLSAFVAGGFGETWVAMQVTGLSILVVLVRGCRFPAASALAGSLVAMAIVLAAPGNATRQASFPPPENLLVVGVASVVYGLDFVLRFPISSPAFVISVAGGVLLSIQWKLSPVKVLTPRQLLMFFASSLLLTFASFAPSLWGISAPPPPRTLIAPVFVLACFGTALGCFLGARLHRAQSRSRIVSYLAMLVLLLGVGVHVYGILTTIPRWTEFASAWSEQDQAILSGKAAPRIENPFGLETAGSNPRFWVNQCMSSYYGRPSLVLE